MATLLLIPIGLLLYGTYSPAIVLGQNYLPNRVGLSSGVTLEVAVAIGGGATPIIGKMADLYGIWFSLASIAFLPILFSAIVLSLPNSQKAVVKNCFSELLKMNYYDESALKRAYEKVTQWYAQNGFWQTVILKEEYRKEINQDA